MPITNNQPPKTIDKKTLKQAHQTIALSLVIIVIGELIIGGVWWLVGRDINDDNDHFDFGGDKTSIVCESGTYLKDDYCVPYSGSVVNCLKYSANNICDVCDTGYVLTNNSCNSISPSVAGASSTYFYTGNLQVYQVAVSGIYQIELWGARGNVTAEWVGDSFAHGGYTAGIIELAAGETIYISVGAGQWAWEDMSANAQATDIRISGKPMYDPEGLGSRIMVAGAGGNSEVRAGGSGGGLSGYDGIEYSSSVERGGHAGTQTSGGQSALGATAGTFGKGAVGCTAGGDGYWGGGNGTERPAGGGYCSGGGGGSSYISGHIGAVAITSATNQTPKIIDGVVCAAGDTRQKCSIHYSGKAFVSTIMIDGSGRSWTNIAGAVQPMPNPSGGFYPQGQGHQGNGQARITHLTSSQL